MLQNLSISNFKAFGPEGIALTLAPLSVFIGENGTGKSSVLQALLLLKQSLSSDRLNLTGNLLDLGEYRTVVHSGKDKEAIHFDINLSSDQIKAGELPAVFPSLKECKYTAAFTPGLQRQELDVELSSGKRIHGGYPENNFALGDLELGLVGTLVGSRRVGEPLVISSLGGSLDETHRAKAHQELQSILHTVANFLQDTYIVPAMRGFDRSSYELKDHPVVDIFADGWTRDGAENLLSTLVYRPELEEKVSEFTMRVVGFQFHTQVIPGKRVIAEIGGPFRGLNLVNEGFGGNQLIPLLTQLALAPEGALVGIEEPEIHLHPRAQAAVAEIFAEIVKAPDIKRQIIVTTHSEHLLMRLLTLVAEGKLHSQELSVHYFEKKEGASPVTRLPVNEKGQLSGGLRGFFEASLGQLEGYLKALATSR